MNPGLPLSKRTVSHVHSDLNKGARIERTGELACLYVRSHFSPNGFNMDYLRQVVFSKKRKTFN